MKQDDEVDFHQKVFKKKEGVEAKAAVQPTGGAGAGARQVSFALEDEEITDQKKVTYW